MIPGCFAENRTHKHGVKMRRVGEPEGTMDDEQPDNSNWFDIQLSQSALLLGIAQQDNFENELTQFTNDVTTINEIEIIPEPGLERPRSREPGIPKAYRPQIQPTTSTA
jgi:hypothetical protein